jgi:hypothetical protein
MRFKSKHLAPGPCNDAGMVKPEHIVIACIHYQIIPDDFLVELHKATINYY